MRHLRHIVEAPRRVRQGLLGAGSRARAALPALLTAAFTTAVTAALTAALTACAPGAPPGAHGRSWFQLVSSVFQPISGPGAASGTAPLPWTVQSRVTDFAFLGDTLYGGVNGAGLVAIDLDRNGSPSFTYHYDSPIFAHRTITTLIPRHGELAVHLYFNALLNDVKPESLLLRGICLVSYLPGQKDFGFLIPPFQRKNPDWEAVGFAPVSENEFGFEWKYTDSSQTKFVYTRYRADLQVESASTRDEYVASLGFPSLSGPGIPPALSAFFEAVRARLPDLPPQTALHFKVRSREEPVRRFYRSDPLADSILVVPVFEEKGDLYALLPGGQVLFSPKAGMPEGERGVDREVEGAESKDGRKAPKGWPKASPKAGAIATALLPRLPEGFRYTDIVKANGVFVISWEKVKFTEVDQAGLLFVKSLF